MSSDNSFKPTACRQNKTLESRATMQSRLAKAGFVSLAFVLAVACALLSALVERTGPELVQYGNPPAK